ncbi:MAG: flagellar protein FlaG [Treponema sp.]|nr:flagellar protein FlaG [Treponema sp.]
MGMAIMSTVNRVAGLPGDRVAGAAKLWASDIRSSAPSAETAAAKSRTGREIMDVTRNLEQISLSFNRRLQFVLDHQSNEITVKVIDRATDKVIKVLPPEELQRLHSRIEETIGFLFDETV